MNWSDMKLSRADSEKLYNEFRETTDNGMEWTDYDPDYLSLRMDLEEQFVSVMTDLEIGSEDMQKKSGNAAYQLDLRFGLKMYTLLCKKYGMTAREASNSDIWRFVSLRIAPDIVETRYPGNHPDRFWKKPKRIWFRVIWWYIYLSWQGNEDETYRILEHNTTDEILQLVDRCGKGGYHVTLTREIMKQAAELTAEERKNFMFRRIMVLNTARMQVIEPALVDGGEPAYVKSLRSEFKKKGD